MARNKIPRHVGIIPNGNRRWALDHGLPKEAGYAHGINPGLLLYENFKECGIKEVSIYCFTQDNTRRPAIQKQAFSEACVLFAFEIASRGAAPLHHGDPSLFEEHLAYANPGRLTGLRNLQMSRGEGRCIMSFSRCSKQIIRK